MEPTDTPEAEPEAVPSPGNVRPTWTYFLIPGAIVLGAVIVAVAFFLTRGDDSAATPAVANNSDESTVVTGASQGQDLLTTFLGYSRSLSLDETEFRACLSKQSTADTINAGYRQALDLGLTGTPSFFINNKLVVGSQPGAVFEEVISVELRGGATSLDAYSPAIQQLAAAGRFQITDAKVDLTGAAFDGSPSAKVVMAEFSDFQCPFCKRWNDETLPLLRTKLGADVAMAFVHFPIVQIHPNAGNASAAAVCAGEQNKFWEMHDLLFARQAEWQSLP